MNLFDQTVGHSNDLDWSMVHSPKPTAADKRKFGGFVNFYTAFSEAFADDAIKMLGAKPGDTLLDPFVGTGTSLAAANRAGVSAIGVELDPFSAIIAKARVAKSYDPSRLKKAAKNASRFRGVITKLDDDMHDEGTVLFAQGVASEIEKSMDTPFDKAWKKILRDTRSKFDTELLLLAALLIAASRSGKVVKGSNPVWLRRPIEGEATAGGAISELFESALSILKDMANENANEFGRAGSKILYGDARAIGIRDSSVDFLLTSPPYLNRLDYIVSHLPAVNLLAHLIKLDTRQLRERMVGTTLIHDKSDDKRRLGKRCKDVLNEIRNHTSKASASYYYWNYLNYFRSMRQLFEEAQRVLKQGGTGALVVQNSYYKDVRIDVPHILCDIAAKSGLQCQVVRDQTLKTHMGKMSPSQRSHVQSKTLNEYVIYFEN